MWLSKCTFVQISDILKVCVQNVLHVLEYKLEDVDATAWPLHWWMGVGIVPTLDQVRLHRVNVTNTAAIDAPEDYSKSCSLNGLWSGLLAGHRAGAVKSDVNVNSCTVSHWLRQHSVTSVRVTAVPYNTVLETEIFCHRYLKINNSAIN